MENIYSTKRHLLYAVVLGVATICFIIVGTVLCYETFLRVRWPNVQGEVVSCVQSDILVQRHRSPGNRLYFEERTVEIIDYCYAVNGRTYLGRHKESLKASDAWCKGARRELISRTSHKPIKVWFCSSNPTKSTIEEPSLLDAPAWPWILAAFLFLLCLVQLGERRESIRLNESLPKALEKAQIDAFRRKIGHSRHKVLHRRL